LDEKGVRCWNLLANWNKLLHHAGADLSGRTWIVMILICTWIILQFLAPVKGANSSKISFSKASLLCLNCAALINVGMPGLSYSFLTPPLQMAEASLSNI